MKSCSHIEIHKIKQHIKIRTCDNNLPLLTLSKLDGFVPSSTPRSWEWCLTLKMRWNWPTAKCTNLRCANGRIFTLFDTWVTISQILTWELFPETQKGVCKAVQNCACFLTLLRCNEREKKTHYQHKTIKIVFTVPPPASISSSAKKYIFEATWSLELFGPQLLSF